MQKRAIQSQLRGPAKEIALVRVNYDSAMPFDFDGLCIRELTPSSLESASIATIDVPFWRTASHRPLKQE